MGAKYRVAWASDQQRSGPFRQQYLRIIDVPPPATWPQVLAHPLLQLRGDTLAPAEEGGVMDLHASVCQHLLEVTVAVANRELQILAHGTEDHVRWEAEAVEGLGGGHGRWSWAALLDRGNGSAAPTRSHPAVQCNRSAGALGRDGFSNSSPPLRRPAAWPA
jgi:hypothetical protein